MKIIFVWNASSFFRTWLQNSRAIKERLEKSIAKTKKKKKKITDQPGATSDLIGGAIYLVST